MSQIISLPSSKDSRGALTIIEKVLPFAVKRVYYIYNVTSPDQVRGGHRHKKTNQALICVSGSCRINLDDGETQSSVLLDSPDKCLIVEAKDFHTMDQFTSDAVLLVLASEYYNASDYIDTPYTHE